MKTSQGREQFLINPFGLTYSEVTASNLVTIDLSGNVLDPGTTQLGCNLAGYMLHSAIHEARPEVRCVIHVHTAPGVAVAAMACGLLPISQEALTVCKRRLYNEEINTLLYSWVVFLIMITVGFLLMKEKRKK